MQGFTKKVHLTLNMPTQEDARGDCERILDGLRELGYTPISMSPRIYRILYPLCRNAGFDITATIVCREQDYLVTDLEAFNTTKEHYGLAADLGSTTVHIQLIDMNTEKVLAFVEDINGQTKYGADILTRIIFAKDNPLHLKELQKATIETFDRLFQKLEKISGVSMKKCHMLVLAGNTTMIHLLLDLDPWVIFSSPYAPVICSPDFLYGNEIGFSGYQNMTYLVPAIANYLGGDITSGLLTTDFYKKDGLSVFFDIGTNGELVLGNRDFLIAGAGAAGPALEGGVSKYGMRAAKGAIDSVKICGDRLTFHTIGQAEPVGICGSGIIDLLAEMRLHGWIDISGQLNEKASSRIQYIEELEEYAVIYAYASETAISCDLIFSQTDIEQYLNTKAAAHTMLDCLLESAGVSKEDLTAFYTSGAFGTFTDLESAITIGIFPDLKRTYFHCLENSSLNGARTLLLDHSRLQDIHYFQETIYYVPFASIPDFLIRMQAAKFIPHTDLSQYPTVVEKILMQSML